MAPVGPDFPPTHPHADPFPAAGEPVRGQALGRYLVLSVLGSGAMGTVFLAYDPELDRRVALKLLNGDRLGGTDGRARLLREAQALARLAHPNVVAVHDLGSLGDEVFVAMEHVAGRSLAELLADDRPSWERLLAIFLQAGEGLAAAHAAGLVHRDFKPANVLVGDDGRVRVADFGLARATRERPTDVTVVVVPEAAGRTDSELLSSTLTSEGSLVGTPSYMAPEQLEGKPATPASDQYSFAVALWEALYGAHPFSSGGFVDLVRAVAAGRRIPPPAETPVPRWIRPVLERGSALRPEDRYPSLAALLAALRPRRLPARRLALAGLGVVAAVAVGLWLGHRAADRALLCRGAERRLEGAWDDGRRAALAATLGGLDRPWATGAAAATTRLLDGFAGEWVALHTDLCEATRLRGERSEQLLDLGMACLDRRRGELAAVVDLLATADVELAERAPIMAASLPELAPCRDAEALLGPTPPPADPERRRELDALGGDLAAVQALFWARRYAEGQQRLAPLAERARRLDHPPFSAELHRVAGLVADGAGDYDLAAREFEAGVIAAEAANDEPAKVGLATALAKLEATRRSRLAEADWWVELAAAARLGLSEELLEAQVEATRGIVRRVQGRSAEATAALERALEIRRRVLGPRDLEVADTLNSLGNLENGRGEAEAAGRAYSEAIAIYEELFGPDHPQLAKLYNNLGTAERGRYRYAEARGALERALELHLSVVGSDHPAVGSTLYNIGNVLVDESRPAEAEEKFRQALAIHRREPGEDSLDVAMDLEGLANALTRQGRADEAMDLYQQSIATKQRLLGEGLAVALSAWNIGVALAESGDLPGALAMHQRSLELYERLAPDHVDTADARGAVGRILVELGRRTEGRDQLERTVAVYEREGTESHLAALSRFALAKLLVADPAMRARAARLAASAAAFWESAGPPAARWLAEVRAWQVAHPAGE